MRFERAEGKPRSSRIVSGVLIGIKRPTLSSKDDDYAGKISVAGAYPRRRLRLGARIPIGLCLEETLFYTMKKPLMLFVGAGLMLSLTSRSFAQWQPVPLMTAAQRAQTQIGGEGAQWVRALAWSRDASLALWGTDVGGLFRSLDEGLTWEPCNVGYTPRGTAGLAIDPGNSRRVLSVGANSVASNYHGIWLSEDGAASWQQSLQTNIAGAHDNREQLAFDASTYNATQGLTRVVYWSRIGDDKPNWGEADKHPALYKSLDGGRTWAEMPGSSALGDSILKVHPTKKVVYAGTPTGFRRSLDGGATWKQTLEGKITGLDVSRAAPDRVWLTQSDGVHVSNDAGATWTRLGSSATLNAPDSPLRQIQVSPADANRVVLWREGPNYKWVRFYSHDGGASWRESRIDGSLSFLPTNARNGLFKWHPRDAQVLLSVGGDYPTRSVDGGAVYAWTGDGVNNILTGAAQFNARNPDLLFVSSQDYNGASTLDGGKSWTYQNPSGNGWGGFTYGGYALNPQVMVVGTAQGWGQPRALTVTRDGGKTWVKTGLFFGGTDNSAGAPGDPNVVFASNFRSADAAQTWTAMTDCDAVLTSTVPTGEKRNGELWGTKKVGEITRIVASLDNGASWRVVATRPDVADLAVDARGALWAISQGALWKCDNTRGDSLANDARWSRVENLPHDQQGAPRVRSVALDPQNADLIYLATNRDVLSSSASVLRSRDGGASWENLTRQTPLDGTNKDGGRESFWVRVHPQTRQAWFVTSCYGIWKMPAP